MPKAKKHTHKILKLTGAHSHIYKCADPNCAFLIRYAQIYHLIGRASICWGCGEVFSLTEDVLREEFPQCLDCTSGEIKELVEDVAPRSELDKYLEALAEDAKSK